MEGCIKKSDSEDPEVFVSAILNAVRTAVTQEAAGATAVSARAAEKPAKQYS